MTDDRSEMQANRDAGLAKRHERRLAHAQETRPVVDREALLALFREWKVSPPCPPGDAFPSERANHRRKLADAVLALLPTEAETKALAETATKLGYELGRKEALEEAAAKADWLAEGVANPEKPYNDAFVHACGVVARHIRDLT